MEYLQQIKYILSVQCMFQFLIKLLGATFSLLVIFNDSYVRDVQTHVCSYLLKKCVTFSDLGQSWNDSLMGIHTDIKQSYMRRDRDGEPVWRCFERRQVSVEPAGIIFFSEDECCRFHILHGATSQKAVILILIAMGN